MMAFEGDRDFPQAPADVWAKLSDARFLVQCIPDSSPVGTPEPRRAQCTVRPGFSFVRGSLEVTLEVVEAIAAQSIRIAVSSKGIGTTADVETMLTFQPQQTGSRVHWKAEVTRLGGLLKAVPGGLIRGAAQKVIEDVWTSVAERLQS